MILSIDELTNIMVESACKFLEFYTQFELDYYRDHGYVGPDPKRFHPGVADKFMIRKIMEDVAIGIPKNFRNDHNAPLFAQRALFYFYYPQYHNNGQTPE